MALLVAIRVGIGATAHGGRRVFVLVLQATLLGALPACDGCSAQSTPGPLRPDEHTRFHVTDRLGSNALVLDHQGRVIARTAERPYGEPWIRWSADGRDRGPDYTYTGQERDPTSGSVAIGARHYLPPLGRWASPDPLAIQSAGFSMTSPLEANPYTYVGGDPIDEVDATGYCRRCAAVGHTIGQWLQRNVQAPVASRGRAVSRRIQPELKRAYRATASALATADTVLTQVEAALISSGPPGMVAASIESATVHVAVRGARLLMRTERAAMGASASSSAVRTLRMPQAVGADVTRVRLRHYTRKNALTSIEKDMMLHAGDSNRVFATSARKKPISSKDAQRVLGIRPGKGGAYVEFDANPSEYEIVRNHLTGAREFKFRGNVDLNGRNATFHKSK